METPEGKSLVDSDDDLAGFLAGLRKRYNLDTSPLPAASPLSRLASSTDANIFGSNIRAGQPEFLNPDSIASSPSAGHEYDVAGADAEDTAGAAVSPSGFAAADDEWTAPQSPTSSNGPGLVKDGQGTTEGQQHNRVSADNAGLQGQPGPAFNHVPMQQQYYPAAESESGSCDSPQTLILLQQLHLQQQSASQLAIAAGGAGGSTSTDMLTIVDEALGAVAGRDSPGTTAAMPRAARLQGRESPIPASETAAVNAAGLYSSTHTADMVKSTAAAVAADNMSMAGGPHVHDIPVLNMDYVHATTTPLAMSAAASPQMAAADTSSSTDFDSPSVKKPLYGAFMAAAAAAAAEDTETAAAAGASTTSDICTSAAAAAATTVAVQHLQQQEARLSESASPTSSAAPAPRSSRMGSPRRSPGRVKHNVSFNMQDVAAASAAAAAAQLQQLVVEDQQHSAGLMSPGSMWRHSSSSPLHRVLKHDSHQHHQLQQPPEEVELAVPPQQQVSHGDELYSDSGLPAPQQAKQQKQQQCPHHQQAQVGSGDAITAGEGAMQEQLHQLEPQYPEQQQAEQQWPAERQQQQQQQAVPPRSPALQQAWAKLHLVEGSLQQLQQQHSSTTIELLQESSIRSPTAAAASAFAGEDELQSDEVATSQATAGAAEAATAVDATNADLHAAVFFEAAAAGAAYKSEASSDAVAPAAEAGVSPSTHASVASLAAAGDAPAASGAVNWLQLSNLLSMAGFRPLNLVDAGEMMAAAATATASNTLLPQLGPLHDAFFQVLREYQRRDDLMAQLLQGRDTLCRDVSRSTADASTAERRRAEAVRELDRTKAELTNVRSREIPALETKHKEVQAKLSSEIAKLKHALKEAESAAAAAKQAAAATGQEQLQQQLQDALKERERCILECERLASEVARQKPYLRDLERAAAAARATARQSDEAAALLQRQLGQMRQQQQQELDALAAELNKARHTVREAEQQLSALRAEATSRSDTTQELMKQLASERTQHEEQTDQLSSELQKLRQQLLALQQAAAKAEAAAKADCNAAVYSSKQLAVQERSHSAEVTKLMSELKQAREANQLLQAKLQEADSAVVQQAAAAAKAASESKTTTSRAANLALELYRVQASSRQHLQLLSQQLSECKRTLADTQQQLTSTQAELRRLRAAAGLVDGTVGVSAAAPGALAAAAAAAPVSAGTLSAEGNGSSAPSGFSIKPLAAAKVVLQQIGDGNLSMLAAQQHLEQEQHLMESTFAPATSAAASAASGDQSGDVDKENGSLSNANIGSAAAEPVSKKGTAEVNTATAAAVLSSDADLAAALSRAVRAEASAARAEGSLVAVRYKMLSLEALGAKMEREIESLRERLGDKVIKEERRLARDKSAYGRIRQAYASSMKRPAGMSGGVEPGSGAAAATRRAAAGAVAAAARELRPVELVGIYEGQKEALERELAAAKAEVNVLAGQLRDAQNLLITKDRAAAVAAAAAGLKGGSAAVAGLGDPAAAVAAQRKAAELTRELCTVRGEAAAALREAAKRLAETEAQVKQLSTNNDDLQQELSSRPTQQEHRQLKREIDMLQRKIASLKRQTAAAAAGGTAAAGEEALALTAAAVAGEGCADGEAWPPGEGGLGLRVLGGNRSVAAAVARDRAVARLGLGVVEEYPRAVLVDLVQDVCVVLELRDATLLVPNLRKMAAVLGAIPKLEAFVAQVCEACFNQGLMFVPASVQHSMNPGTVPQLLQHWLALLKQGEQLRQLAQQLQQLLSQHYSLAVTDPQAAAAALAGVKMPVAAAGEVMQPQQLQQVSQQLLAHVQHLLQVENEAIAAEDLLSAAKGLMATQPDGLLQSLLSHVLQLFDIPNLEALPAAVNKVYVHYSELVNFFRALCSLLCLPNDAGSQAAMAAVNSLLQQSKQPPSKVRQAAAELQRASGLTSSAAAAADPAMAAAGAVSNTDDGDADRALQALLAVLGVSSVQQAAHLHETMKQRLERLDEVLPRYQRLASQLYERLRVVSLEDILPALDAVLSAA